MPNIIKRKLEKAEDYLLAINQISQATNGFIQYWESNLFFEEACQSLINSIDLFQQGYFDAAFFMLRQSLETSIGILYLMSNKDKIKAWENLEKGFEQGRMADWLKNNEETFKEIKERMHSFFDRVRSDELVINKYVHKQGYKSFYSIARNDEQMNLWLGETKEEFEKILKDCIGAVAVYRLSLDALPLAMGEENAALRAPDLLLEALSNDFLTEYIGTEAVEGYRQTQIYKDTMNWLLSQPKHNESVYELKHYQYVNRMRKEDYFKQWGLLSLYDQLAVQLFLISEKVSYLYIDSFFVYNSETPSKNNGFVCGKKNFEEFFLETDSDFNVCYKNAYHSRINLGGEYSYLEHVEKMTKEEIVDYRNLSSKISEKYKDSFALLRNC